MSDADPKSAGRHEAPVFPEPVAPSDEEEFARIPSPRSRHPIVAGAAVLLALGLVYRVRGDLAYALSSSTPVDLGDARALVSADPSRLPVNRYVRLRGAPDRASAVILDTQGSWEFSQFFRLLGTGNRWLVKRRPDPLPVAEAERDTFVGRLARLSDISFADGLRRHFRAHVSATHFFSPTAFRDALARAGGGHVETHDLLGDRVTLAPADEIVLGVSLPGQIRIELPRARFPGPPEARAAVERVGGEVVEAVAARQQPVVVLARFPETVREQALSALGDLDRRVRFAPARRSHRLALRQASIAPDGLVVKSPDGTVTTLALAEVETVRTVAPVDVAADALVIVEGARPRDHLKVLVIVALLIGFAAVNLAALVRPLTPRP